MTKYTIQIVKLPNGIAFNCQNKYKSDNEQIILKAEGNEDHPEKLQIRPQKNSRI